MVGAERDTRTLYIDITSKSQTVTITDENEE